MQTRRRRPGRIYIPWSALGLLDKWNDSCIALVNKNDTRPPRRTSFTWKNRSKRLQAEPRRKGEDSRVATLRSAL